MSHGKFYYINNKNAGFFKLSLNLGNDATYPEGAITIYNNQKTILNRYGVDNDNQAVSNSGENELYIFLPTKGYYYIEIVLPRSNYTNISFTIEETEQMNINYTNRLDGIAFDEIFFNQISTSYFKEIIISHRSKVELDTQATRQINTNISVYLLQKCKEPGYEVGDEHYYTVPKLIGAITKTNWAPVFTIILEPGTYYIGYSDNDEKVGIHIGIRRKVNTELNIYSTLVTDPAYNQGFELGTEVTFNNGELLGNTITKGFTRNLYLMVENRVHDPMSRLEYDWYSSNENTAKVTEYGTVLGMSVTEDTPVTIYAINKIDPTIVYAIDLTILNETSMEELEIECNMTYSYSQSNGTYQLALDFSNCPYPYIQYYSFNVYEEDPINVSIDNWGRVTSSGVGEVTIVGDYNLNIRVRLIIHLIITE